MFYGRHISFQGTYMYHICNANALIVDWYGSRKEFDMILPECWNWPYIIHLQRIYMQTSPCGLNKTYCVLIQNRMVSYVHHIHLGLSFDKTLCSTIVWISCTLSLQPVKHEYTFTQSLDMTQRNIAFKAFLVNSGQCSPPGWIEINSWTLLNNVHFI